MYARKGLTGRRTAELQRHAPQRRHRAHEGDAMFINEPTKLLGQRYPGRMQDDIAAGHQRRQSVADEAVSKMRRQRHECSCKHGFADGLCIEREASRQRAKAQHHALRRAGRARCEQHQRRIIGVGLQSGHGGVRNGIVKPKNGYR